MQNFCFKHEKSVINLSGYKAVIKIIVGQDWFIKNILVKGVHI